MSVAMNGNDTVILDTRIMKDFGDGDTTVLTFPNNLVEAKRGKNGNVLYALNSTGKLANVVIRTLLGSEDDKYLNSRLQEYLNDPAAFILLTGEFIKRVGDGEGNVTNVVYQMSGGVVQKMVEAKENVEGDTEQAIAIYTLVFANSDRALT